jgi:hypothetical protein
VGAIKHHRGTVYWMRLLHCVSAMQVFSSLRNDVSIEESLGERQRRGRANSSHRTRKCLVTSLRPPMPATVHAPLSVAAAAAAKQHIHSTFCPLLH